MHFLGVIRQQQGRHAEALGLIGRAIQIAPGKAAYHNNYGAALISLKRFPEADTSFRRALTIRPNYADALANLGMVQVALGDEVAAEKSLRLALQCQAWHRGALTRLVSLLERHGRTEDALTLLESAIIAAPCPGLGQSPADSGQLPRGCRTLPFRNNDSLANPALGLASHVLGQFPNAPTCDGRNIVIMPALPPQQFRSTVYSVTKLLLVPSLCNESFGLVAAEAMLNGIPVLASNRGALPETIGDRGFLFDIPAKYTPGTQEVPTAEEVEPWVETIIRLWDDAAEYDRRSQAAREQAQRWHPDRLASFYRDFFSTLCQT
jgi:hypothetical protein